MSYDLAVFDPDIAPKVRDQFFEWFDIQTDWKESHDYGDPAVSTKELRAWFLDMIKDYPAMNGKYAVDSDVFDSETESLISDYSIGRSFIMIAFAWSVADRAYDSVFRLASRHGVGFIDVSGSDGSVWFPSGPGGLEVCFKSAD